MQIKPKKSHVPRLICLAAVSAAIILLCTAVGSVMISPLDALKIIRLKLTGSAVPEELSTLSAILINLRLPRVFLAFISGGAMSLGGAIAQSLLSNPLASPYTMGVSSGASVGAALVTIFGLGAGLSGHTRLALAGTVFSIAAVAVCLIVSSALDRNLGSYTIVLIGMVSSLFLSAIFTLLSGLARDKTALLLRWQLGSFNAKGWDSVFVLLPVTMIGFIICLVKSSELDIISLSDRQAATIGVNVRAVKLLMFSVLAVMTGACVSFSGVIGFVDLVSSHLARRFVGPGHAYMLPSCFLIGGSLMTVSDLIARMAVSGTELPVGAVTAFIGAPFFVAMFFLKSGRGREAGSL